MAEIELVIKIDEEQYKFIKQSMTISEIKNYHALLFDICKHIANGTPLPKRLVDADKFINSLKGIERLHIDDELRNNILKAVYTNIIEADKVKGEG